jgi:hypothetical protein
MAGHPHQIQAAERAAHRSRAQSAAMQQVARSGHGSGGAQSHLLAVGAADRDAMR